jgi:hypothetical protein
LIGGLGSIDCVIATGSSLDEAPKPYGYFPERPVPETPL